MPRVGQGRLQRGPAEGVWPRILPRQPVSAATQAGGQGGAAGVRLPKADETGRHGPGGRKSRAMQAFLTMLLPREQQVEVFNVSGAIRP